MYQVDTSPECNVFKQPQIKWTRLNTECPFTGLCLGPPNSTLILDTGLIDSRDDLGINSRDEDQIQYREVSTCTPITTDGYVSTFNTTTSDNVTLTAYAAFYGPNLYEHSEIGNYDIANATYVTSNYASLKSSYDVASGSPYNLGYVRIVCLHIHRYSLILKKPFSVAESFPDNPNAGFLAKPELFVPNSTVTLVFASSLCQYREPSDDLWLPAHTPFNSSILEGTQGAVSTGLVYTPDKTLNVMACTAQYQFCNSFKSADADPNCTSLQSIDRFVFDGATFFTEQANTSLFTDDQTHIIKIIIFAAAQARIGYYLPHLESPILADDLGSGLSSAPLPSNQWITEASNWFTVSQTHLQSSIVDFATGPPGSDAQYTYGLTAKNAALQYFCSRQIIRRQGYTNFSILAISLIFGFGGLIICISFFIETLVGYFQTKFGRGKYHFMRWHLDPALQLQRMAFEETGLGSWKQGANEIPITEKGEVFAPATEWDVWHPSIKGKEVPKVENVHVEELELETPPENVG